MRRLKIVLCVYALVLVLLFHFLPGVVFFAPAVVFLLFGAVVSHKLYKDSLEDLKKRSSLRLEDYENEKKFLSEGIAKGEELITELRNKEMMMVSLYEITKKCHQALTFNEIFGALNSFLKEYFVFHKSELLILKETEGYIKIDKIYKLHQEDGVAHEETEKDYGDILTLFTKDKKEVYIPREGGHSFGAVPLLSENKFVGILTVEDLPWADFDRFVIVATQFALEIKKVLLYETVEALAITDSLTGLYTRRYFFERLNEELGRSKKYGFRFSFLMVDIDDFKKCNDAHGHLVGDVILRDVSRIIKEGVREIDLVARYGGEEFSLILPETDKSGAMLAAERIRKKIDENVFKAYDEVLKVTVSIGVAVYPEDGSDVIEVIEKADKALYAAKNSGKNIVCEYKE